jgi:hypothetical protein
LTGLDLGLRAQGYLPIGRWISYLSSKTLLVESEHDWKGIFVIDAKGQKVELKKVKFIVTGNSQTADVPQKHRIFNQK